jgi:hypothetical protein
MLKAISANAAVASASIIVLGANGPAGTGLQRVQRQAKHGHDSLTGEFACMFWLKKWF